MGVIGWFAENKQTNQYLKFYTVDKQDEAGAIESLKLSWIGSISEALVLSEVDIEIILPYIETSVKLIPIERNLEEISK